MARASSADRRLVVGSAVFTALVAVAVYWSSLGNGFVYDDNLQILRNQWITSAAHLPDIFTSHTFGFTERAFQAISYRPVFYVVYMAEYALFGLDPLGWHLVNVGLHAANSAMVFLLVLLLLGRSGKGTERPAGEDKTGAGLRGLAPPLAAGIIFAVHPVNTEVVAWVGCIPELFYTLMVLVSFTLFIRSLGEGADGAGLGSGRATGVPWARIASVLCLFVAALTKETAVIMPVMLFACDRLMPRSGRPERTFSFAVISRHAPYLAAAVAYLVIRSHVLGADFVPTERLNDFLSPAQFILNSLVILAKDFGMLLLPLGSYPLQLFDPVYSLAEPRTFASIGVLVAVPAVLVAFRRRLNPLVLLSLMVIVLPLIPALYAPAISKTPYADRYLYFPSIGYALALALAFRWLYSRVASRGGRPLVWWTIAVFVFIASVFAAWSSKKALFWKDDMSLWSSSLRGSPGNYIAVHAIGAEFFKEGKYDDAIKTLEYALMLNETNPHPEPTVLLSTHKVLATAYGRKGLLDKAIREYDLILRAEPDHEVANYNLAALYRQKGRYADAVEFYSRALLLANKQWQYADIHAGLGESYAGLGQWNKAAQSYENALGYAPGDPDIISRLEEAIRMGGGALKPGQSP